MRLESWFNRRFMEKETAEGKPVAIAYDSPSQFDGNSAGSVNGASNGEVVASDVREEAVLPAPDHTLEAGEGQMNGVVEAGVPGMNGGVEMGGLLLSGETEGVGVHEDGNSKGEVSSDEKVEVVEEQERERTQVDDVLELVQRSRAEAQVLVEQRDKGRRARSVWNQVLADPEHGQGDLRNALGELGVERVEEFPALMQTGNQAERQLEQRGVHTAHAHAEILMIRSQETEVTLDAQMAQLHTRLTTERDNLLQNGMNWREQIALMRNVFETVAEVREAMDQFGRVNGSAAETIRSIYGEPKDGNYRNENHRELDTAAIALEKYSQDKLGGMRTEHRVNEEVNEEQTQRILTETINRLGIGQDEEMLKEMGIQKVYDRTDDDLNEGSAEQAPFRYEIIDRWSNFAHVVRQRGVQENVDRQIIDTLENRPEESVAVCYLINDRMKHDFLAVEGNNDLREQVQRIRSRREEERAMENTDNRSLWQKLRQFRDDMRPRQLQRRMFNSLANWATSRVQRLDDN